MSDDSLNPEPLTRRFIVSKQRADAIYLGFLRQNHDFQIKSSDKEMGKHCNLQLPARNVYLHFARFFAGTIINGLSRFRQVHTTCELLVV